jgi:hypothetical protein
LVIKQFQLRKSGSELPHSNGVSYEVKCRREKQEAKGNFAVFVDRVTGQVRPLANAHDSTRKPKTKN